MSGLLSPTRKEIEEAVEKHEEEWGCIDKYLYRTCLEWATTIKLCKITEKDVEYVVKTFLIKWGRLGRVLYRKGKRGWERKILDSIKSHCRDLSKFRNLRLEDVELHKYKEKIRALFNNFSKIIGSVGAAKLLHLFAPEFFPLWDTDIRNKIRKEIKGKEEYKGYKIDASGEGYYYFMLVIQKLLKSKLKIWDMLAKRYKKPSKLRVIDNYLWVKTRK